MELGWGSFDFNDETKVDQPEKWTWRVDAVQKHSIRPLLLLNANSGAPVPAVQSWRLMSRHW
jgi:hypothetical protein